MLPLLFISFWLLCASGAVLRNFQVTQPPIVPRNAKTCTVKVLQRDFEFTFGEGEVVTLSPPTDCGSAGSWSAVTLNLTVTSNGTQFDRLGIVTYHNVEIWRTSTPEPTRGDGIIWTYIKEFLQDVSHFIPLFANAGTFILQIDNIIQPGLDGVYSATMHATYYASSPSNPPAKQADVIIPISTMSNTTGNDASVPPAFSRNITIPQNAVKIFAELLPSGNAQEEFWYYNVPNEFISNLPAGTTFPNGPFREVRLLVDGRLAGVAFPFAPIFTGGFDPLMWRPIAAYAALDVPTYAIDVTPFVPLLTDGNPHTFTIDVASAEDTHGVNGNWYVSGSLQVLTDTSSARTTGSIKKYIGDSFASTSTTGTVSDNGDLDFTVIANHDLHIESEIISGSGKRTSVVWSQKLQYSNNQRYLENTKFQLLNQRSFGEATSLHNGIPVVSDLFSYPLVVNFTYQGPDQRNWTTTIDHSYDRVNLPSPLRLGTTIHSRQQTGGFFQLQTGGNFGNGTSNNTFSYIDVKGNTYVRKVNSALSNVTFDFESGSLAPAGGNRQIASDASQGAFGPIPGVALPKGRIGE